VPGESQTIGGFGRNDRFAYQQRFGGPGELRVASWWKPAPPAAASLPRRSNCART
jgi:hypothetical protein